MSDQFIQTSEYESNH